MAPRRSTRRRNKSTLMRESEETEHVWRRGRVRVVFDQEDDDEGGGTADADNSSVSNSNNGGNSRGGHGNDDGDNEDEESGRGRRGLRRGHRTIMVTDEEAFGDRDGGDEYGGEHDELTSKRRRVTEEESYMRTRTKKTRERAMQERQDMDRRWEENLRIAEQRDMENKRLEQQQQQQQQDEQKKKKKKKRKTSTTTAAKKKKKKEEEEEEDKKTAQKKQKEKEEEQEEGKEIDEKLTAKEVNAEKQDQTVGSEQKQQEQQNRAKKEVVVEVEDDEAEEEEEEEEEVEGPQEEYVPLKDRLVNVSKTEKEMDVLLSPDLACQLKPHQLDSLRFCWDNICQQTDPSLKGCIIAHSMGLGKTLQTITFISMFFDEKRGRNAVIVCPKSVLRNWKQEFRKWSNLVGEVSLFMITDRITSYKDRGEEIELWAKTGEREGRAVFMITYDMAALLLHKKYQQPRDNIGNDRDALAKLECQKKAEKYLLATDLLILDEGHIIKNAETVRYQALSRVKTRNRILLTGTPLQNRLKEYHTMIGFVRRGMWSRLEFKDLFEEPIKSGFKEDSSLEEVKAMLRASHVLSSMIQSFVHRRGTSLLKKSLPEKHEYVISVKINEFQRVLYRAFLKEIEKRKEIAIREGNKTLIAWYSNVLCYSVLTIKIINHPDMLRRFCERKGLEAVKMNTQVMDRVIRRKQLREHMSDMKASSYESDDSDDSYIDIDDSPNDVSSLTIDEETGEDFLSMDLLSWSPKNENGKKKDNQKVKAEGSKKAKKESQKVKSEKNKKKKKKNKKKNVKGKDVLSPKTPTDVIDLSDDDDDADGEVQIMESTEEKQCEESERWYVAQRRAPAAGMSERKAGKQPQRQSTLEIDSEEEELWMDASDEIVDEVDADGFSFDWAWPVLIPEYEMGNMQHSSKMMLLMRIIEETLQRREKILIFSGFTEVLDIIEDVLANTPLDIGEGEDELEGIEPEPTKLRKHLHYCRLDGKVKSSDRMRMIQDFNHKDSSKSVFLVSTRAGGLGVNMIGANRVVIFDVSWNGSWDSQAIARSWRYGQTKPVYVYRFVASGTSEETVRNIQMAKEWHVRKVVDSEAPVRSLTAEHFDMWKFDQSTPTELEPLEKFEEQYQTDQILSDICADDAWRRLIKEVVIHESLFEEDPEDMLNEEEKRSSKEEYERRMRQMRQARLENGTHMDDGHDSDNDDRDRRSIWSIDVRSLMANPFF